VPISETPLSERIARVLAGRQLSGNAQGLESHASTSVDLEWKERVPDALAILRTMREPDARMASAGDADIWRAMVAAAIEALPDHESGNPLAPPIHVKAAS
jgi:hypothetical protein